MFYPNQTKPEELTPHIIGYAAALIDRCNLYIEKVRKKDSYRIYIRVRVLPKKQTEFMARYFGGKIRRYDGWNEQRTDRYEWLVYSDAASDCLQSVLPYLMENKFIAECLIAMKKTLVSGPPTAARKEEMPEIKLLRDTIYNEYISHINAIRYRKRKTINAPPKGFVFSRSTSTNKEEDILGSLF